MLMLVRLEVPWGCGQKDEFLEDFGAFNGSQAANHAGDGVADVDAAVNVELVQDGQQVVGVGVERGVAVEAVV